MIEKISLGEWGKRLATKQYTVMQFNIEEGWTLVVDEQGKYYKVTCTPDIKTMLIDDMVKE